MIKNIIGILLVAAISITPLYAATVSKQFYNIGNKKVSIPSVVDGGTTYTELRSISTYTGLKIDYNDGIVIIEEAYDFRGHHKILEINTKNGKAVRYDYYNSTQQGLITPVIKSNNWKEINGIKEFNTEIKISEGKTYLPLRLIAEQMEFNLTYKNGTVILADGKFTYITTDKERDFINWGLSEFANSGFYLTKSESTEGKFLSHPKGATDLSHNLVWYGSGLFGYGTDVDPEYAIQLEKFKSKKIELINKKAELERSNGALSAMTEKFYNSLLNSITGLINQLSLIVNKEYNGSLTNVNNAINSYNNAVSIDTNVFLDYSYGPIVVSEVNKQAKQ